MFKVWWDISKRLCHIFTVKSEDMRILLRGEWDRGRVQRHCFDMPSGHFSVTPCRQRAREQRLETFHWGRCSSDDIDVRHANNQARLAWAETYNIPTNHRLAQTETCSISTNDRSASTLISSALHLGKEYINKRITDSIEASCNAWNINRDVIMRCNAVERTQDSHHYQINTLTNVLSNYDYKN